MAIAEDAYRFTLEETNGVKSIVTYSFGTELDRRDNSSDTSKSFTDLMTEVMPLIQADLDAYGIG